MLLARELRSAQHAHEVARGPKLELLCVFVPDDLTRLAAARTCALLVGDLDDFLDARDSRADFGGLAWLALGLLRLDDFVGLIVGRLICVRRNRVDVFVFGAEARQEWLIGEALSLLAVKAITQRDPEPLEVVSLLPQEYDLFAQLGVLSFEFFDVRHDVVDTYAAFEVLTLFEVFCRTNCGALRARSRVRQGARAARWTTS